ncbi:MAG TPA: hypothetical protein VK826_07060 [Bacteroidia bacterium]|nr:hypothetical protein [Bacteroidia bacterium]
MKKLTLIIFVASAIALLMRDAKAKPEIAAKTDGATGWWILHEYHDRILNNRAIGAFSFEAPVWEAVILKVTADSIYTAGTIIPTKILARLPGDTLHRSNHFSDLVFVYNKKKAEITVRFSAMDTTKKVFHYRRLVSTDYLQLTQNLFDRKHHWALQTNYHEWFRVCFFQGQYRSVKDGTIMKLGSDETVTGFEKWNAYHFDDFFGTLHYTGKLDRIRFEDSTKTGVFKDYNWRWSNDTLILRPFLGNDIEKYKLSATETRFVKIPPAEK